MVSYSYCWACLNSCSRGGDPRMRQRSQPSLEVQGYLWGSDSVPQDGQPLARKYSSLQPRCSSITKWSSGRLFHYQRRSSFASDGTCHDFWDRWLRRWPSTFWQFLDCWVVDPSTTFYLFATLQRLLVFVNQWLDPDSAGFAGLSEPAHLTWASSRSQLMVAFDLCFYFNDCCRCEYACALNWFDRSDYSVSMRAGRHSACHLLEPTPLSLCERICQLAYLSDDFCSKGVTSKDAHCGMTTRRCERQADDDRTRPESWPPLYLSNDFQLLWSESLLLCHYWTLLRQFRLQLARAWD